MAHLTVWKFETPEGAEEAVGTFAHLQEGHLVKLVDAATVSWPKGSKRPRTRQAVDLVSSGGLDGAFWGLLFGTIFLVPVVGAAMGAALGALSGSFGDYGIDDALIGKVREEVGEGTSALFLLTEEETTDRIAERFRGSHAKLVQTNLSRSEEAALREQFGA